MVFVAILLTPSRQAVGQKVFGLCRFLSPSDSHVIADFEFFRAQIESSIVTFLSHTHSLCLDRSLD